MPAEWASYRLTTFGSGPLLEAALVQIVATTSFAVDEIFLSPLRYELIATDRTLSVGRLSVAIM